MSKGISVRKFLSDEQFQWTIVICLQLIFIGFVCSRALVSIGMVSLLVISLFHQGVIQSLKTYFQRKELHILSGFFLIVFVSGIYSEDKSDWLSWVRIKLPYIALPIVFAPLKKIGEMKFVIILYGFILTFFISAILVLGNYFLHYEAITESFLRGNSIPMPYSHIRYTLMLAFSVFCCWYLIEKKFFLFNGKERWLQVFVLSFSFTALHILSVRSALLALYIGIFFLLLRYIFVQKKYMVGGILLLFAVVVPYFAIKFVPSLHNKWAYMQYDIQQFKEGKVQNLSDGVRFVSIKGGLEIAKQNLLFGVGAGDVSNELQKFYSHNYTQLEQVDRKPIHNQFVWVLAGTGVIGLIVFLTAFFFPLFYQNDYRNWLFVLLHLILFSSFFTESTLEEQMGTGFYLVFLLLLMNQLKKE